MSRPDHIANGVEGVTRCVATRGYSGRQVDVYASRAAIITGHIGAIATLKVVRACAAKQRICATATVQRIIRTAT